MYYRLLIGASYLLLICPQHSITTPRIERLMHVSSSSFMMHVSFSSYVHNIQSQHTGVSE
jgi:hypothetical protein